MNNAKRVKLHFGKILALAGVLVALQGCGPGTVYVGVSGPGPWVGYPPGMYGRPYPGGYYGRPGYYGSPWYSPNDPIPQGPQEWVEPEPSKGNELQEVGDTVSPPASSLTPGNSE